MILRILLVILAAWLIRWFLALFLGNKKPATSDKPKSAGGNMVKDPACGMYMDPRLAIKHETKNGIFYFCSEECKKKFLEAASGKSPNAPTSEK